MPASINDPHHTEEKERLEKLLKNRSDLKELQDKNIIKSAYFIPVKEFKKK